MQLDQKEKGFSFQKSGPLDMRMDPTESLTAAEIVNEWPEEKLAELFREYGEEPRWRKAAQVIGKAREEKPFETTGELADLIAKELGKGPKKKLHPATLIFQALRICVNRELDAVKAVLPKAMDALRIGGRLGVMSFHRLEDGIVKAFLKEGAKVPAQNKYREKVHEPKLRLLEKKPIVASEDEVRRNRRSRSAKLRFAEKLR